MTPIPAPISVALVDGLRNEVVVTNDLARRLFPRIEPQDFASAIGRVTQDLDNGRIDTSWSDAAGSSSRGERPVRLESRHGMVVERRERTVAAPTSDVYRVFTGIGGARGWYFANWTWKLRGMMDRLLGGAGLRRGRRHPDELRIGDALDFWRVEDLIPDRLLRLRAEIKLPGRAWLQYEVRDLDGSSELVQTAAFIPRGLFGLAYWYALYPFHSWIFSGLIRAVAHRAESLTSSPNTEQAPHQAADR